MFNEEMDLVAGAGVKKVGLCDKSISKFFVSSMLAGFFVGLGILLIFSLSGQLGPKEPATKLVMGVSFGVALSLVIMAGSELFTGNIFVVTVSLIRKKVTSAQTIKMWIICWLGNLAGAALVAAFFAWANLATGNTLAAIGGAAASKGSGGVLELFSKAILCNILVCLAVWCSIKLKSESGKLIMIFWCLFAFITSGFEHSIANMTVFFTSLFGGAEGVTYGGMFYNLLVTSLGNMVGAMLLAGAYLYISSTKNEQE